MDSVTLHAEGLASKWGFDDGDLLDDIIYDMGLDPLDGSNDDHLSLDHEVLARAVEKFLVPALEAQLGRAVPTFRIGTIHNPIRAEGLDHYGAPAPVEWAGVEVTVPVASIHTIVREVRAERDSRYSPNGGDALAAPGEA